MTNSTLKWSIDCLPSVVADSAGMTAAAPSVSRIGQSSADTPESSWYRRTYFESAETDRLNEAHWSMVDDQPINDVLSYRLR